MKIAGWRRGETSTTDTREGKVAGFGSWVWQQLAAHTGMGEGASQTCPAGFLTKAFRCESCLPSAHSRAANNVNWEMCVLVYGKAAVGRNQMF